MCRVVRAAAVAKCRLKFLYTQPPPILARVPARWWELRAVMSLACLGQQQGKQADAYELLASIYGWFTEGFDTADLQEAKVLLEELGG